MLTSVLHGFSAVAKSMRYQKARRIRNLEFHAIPTDAETGKCGLLRQPADKKNITVDRQTNVYEAT